MRGNKNSKVLLVCVFASLAIHVVLAVILFLPAMAGLFSYKPKVVEEKPQEEPEIVMSFTVQPRPQVVPMVPQLVPDKEKAPEQEVPPSKKFVRTDSSQEQGKVEDTNLIGEHDTVARSTAEADANAPDRSSVAGRKRDFDQSVASNYQDGNLNHDSIAQKKVEEMETADAPSVQPTPEQAEAMEQKFQEKVAKAPEVTPLKEFEDKVEVTEAAKQEALVAELAKKKAEEEAEEAERKKLAEQMEKARKERERLEEEQKRLLEEKRKAEEERKKQMARRESEAGFRANTAPTESVGSIRRKGSQASLNVKSTPTGRYMKKVSDSVAKEWYRRCNERADLLLPGSLTMYWFVKEDGTITSPQIKNQVAGGEIQKGITIQSINAAKIPPMPKEVRDELKGDPLYFQINFEF